LRHWRDVPSGEAVRHRLYGIHETAGVLLASLVLEPLALVPACLAVVYGSYGIPRVTAVSIAAGELVLGAMSWGCAYLLSKKRAAFIGAFRLRTVMVALWSAVLWAIMPATLFGLAGERAAAAIFAFFVLLRLVMSVGWTPYTFVSPRLNVTLRHRVSG